MSKSIHFKVPGRETLVSCIMLMVLCSPCYARILWSFYLALFQIPRDEAILEIQEAQINTAVAAFKKVHGGYPPTLVTLVPHYLDSNVIDLWQYRLTDTGYMLYYRLPGYHDRFGGRSIRRVCRAEGDSLSCRYETMD